MSFNDDEQIVAIQDAPEDEPSTVFPTVGLLEAKLINKTEAPLEETNHKVMLQLTGSGGGRNRAGVDIVTVLDVSGSMQGEDKIGRMKMAMQFVIRKLSPVDRLSVVAFSSDSRRVCPLRQITEGSKAEIEKLVNSLVAGGGTNIAAGLQVAQKVLGDRRFRDGRTVGIVLMSDGQPSPGTPNAADVPTRNVAVYTFGFGADHDPKVLKELADRSLGGTFSDVSKSTSLSVPFSQCLAGLLTVVVQDLTVVATPNKPSRIASVAAGNYPQNKDDDSVTITFGNLYDRETRRVIVDLLLPAVPRPKGVVAMEFTYSYRAKDGLLFNSTPLEATVKRVGAPKEQEREEVIVEESRLNTARMMKAARELADVDKLDDAKDKIVEAQNLLEDAVEEPHPLIEMLKSELKYLLKLLKTKDIYEREGRPFALSSETSHDRQRFAARGDVEKLRLFATPRMDAYLEQAKAFDKDPSKPLPTEEEDVKAEIVADPLASIVGPLSYYIQTAIQALKSIDDILNGARR